MINAQKEPRVADAGQAKSATTYCRENNSFDLDAVANLVKWALVWCDENTKKPNVRHCAEAVKKGEISQWTNEMFIKHPYQTTVVGLLLHDLVVVDCDTVEVYDYFRKLFLSDFDPCRTINEVTRSGFHFYFKRPEWFDRENVFDSVGPFKHVDPILAKCDLKTRCSTGTRGVCIVSPSPNKTWQLAPWDGILREPSVPLMYWIINNYQSRKSSKKSEAPVNVSHACLNSGDPEIVRLVSMLSKERADNYMDWMRLGWCLHNIDPSLLHVWDTFSQQSSKYKKGECEILWENMRDHGLGIGSLHWWARHDNPSEYLKHQNEGVFADIKQCNGSHNAIAEIAYKLFGGKYVCALSNGKLWYRFDGTLWIEDPDAICVKRELFKNLRHHFALVMNRLAIANDEDDIRSSASSMYKNLCQNLLNCTFKLQDAKFKMYVLKEMTEYFYDKDFLKNLDDNPNLIAFSNGVWDLKAARFRAATPEDRVSLNVGYPYSDTSQDQYRRMIEQYFEKLHPNKDQRVYLLQTLARQLYGDTGNELFHIHAGYKGSAGNGKSKFFEILELVLGEYIHKFAVETLVVKQRSEPHKAVPEFKNWKGKRILYCSEPNPEDKLNSGVLKEMTGGEKISFRLCFSNETHKFVPMYKMHIMCNDTPQIDGGDQGVRRRIRKIDYISRFVDAEEADETRYMYAKDMGFVETFKNDVGARLEFLRYVLRHYDHSYAYSMPDIIKDNSSSYVDEHNSVLQFVKDRVQQENNAFFTLKDAKSIFKSCEYYDSKLNLRSSLEKVLRAQCIDSKRISGVLYRYVFYNYKLIISE